ncbi:MAG: SRPBCC family protein [Sphingomonas sp.]
MNSSNLTASLARRATIGLITLLSAGTTPASADTISRSADVNASVSEVWSLIGPFCAIKDWLPPVGQCIADGKNPSTRILVTKDGKAAFVERQTDRSDAEHSYSYTFLSSPLPVSKYASTIKVTAKGNGSSTITWSGSYLPEHGKEKAANEALSGVYEAGLAEIRAMLAK